MRVVSRVGRIRALIARFSLRTNLAILLALVVAILIVDRSQELTRIRSQEIARAHADVTDLAERGAEQQADVVADTKALLRLAVDLPITAADSGPACQHAFRRTVDDLPWLRSLWVVAPDGSAICTNSDRPVTVSLAGRAYLRKAIATHGFVLSDFIVGRITGKPGVAAAMPRITDGNVETIVAAMIEVDWLSRLAAKIGAEHGVEVLLLDSTATVIAAYPTPDKWVGHNFAGGRFGAVVRSTDGTVESTGIDGTRRVISHVRLPDTDAVLAVTMPLESVIAKSNSLARYEIGKILIAGIVSFLVIWFGSDWLLLRPIARLSRAATRLGSGDLETRIETAGLAPELKRLGESFNDMAAQLRNRDADLRRANDRLSNLASKDALTGIANRRSYDEHLAAEWRRTRRECIPLALLAIDVDHFKRFNDCYGHVEGDACLRRFATVLSTAARRSGDFAARTGGEEFALLLPGSSLGEAARIAEALRRDVEALDIAHPQSPESRVTVSIGVAAIPADRADKVSGLVDHADAALYRAKRTGRNRVVSDAQAIALAS